MAPRKKNTDAADKTEIDKATDPSAQPPVPDLTEPDALPESPDSTDDLIDAVPDADDTGARVTEEGPDAPEVTDLGDEDVTPYSETYEDIATSPDDDRDVVERRSPFESESGSQGETLVADDPESNDPYENVATATAPSEPRTGGVFLPALLGGVVAAAVGIGAATLLGDNDGSSEETRAAIAGQNEQLKALDAKIGTVAESAANPNTDAVESQLSALTDQVQTRLDAIGSQMESVATSIGTVQSRLESVDSRLTEVEKRPLVESSETAKNAFAAYERELETLRASLDEQKAQSAEAAAALEKTAANARNEIEQVEERATDLQTEAEAAAEAAAKRAALADLTAALDRGTAYEAALSTLAEGNDIPEALSANAQSGVPSLADLQSDFPAAARAALDASIKETVSSDPLDRFGAFLKTQTGARSLSPREGDDPDAVLSRAEAALQAGDVENTLNEIKTLPQTGQDALAEWVSQAETRLAATSAANKLADTLQAN